MMVRCLLRRSLFICITLSLPVIVLVILRAPSRREHHAVTRFFSGNVDVFEADSAVYAIESKIGPRLIPLDHSNRSWHGYNLLLANKPVKSQIPDQGLPGVLLVSYMRSGSTWLGNILFNGKPDVVYMFEPLAQFYSSIYGVQNNAIADYDVIFTVNGTFRTFPKEELDSVSWMFSRLLSCDLMSMPIEMYMHHFWKWTNKLTTYTNCLAANMILMQEGLSCSQYITSFCGARLFEKPIELKTFADVNPSDVCLYHLWTKYIHTYGPGGDVISRFNMNAIKTQTRLEKAHQNPNHRTEPFNISQRFIQYGQCLENLVPTLAKCLPNMLQLCRGNISLVGIKTVRADMNMVEPLLKRHPHLKVVHLYRDPRAVVRSRKGIPWSQGIYQHNNISNIAESYCVRVARDIRTRKDLEKRYPERLQHVLYDEMVDDPVVGISKLHEFIGKPGLTAQLTSQLQAEKQQLKQFRDKWKLDLSDVEIRDIESSCKTFSTDADFDWDKNRKIEIRENI